MEQEQQNGGGKGGFQKEMRVSSERGLHERRGTITRAQGQRDRCIGWTGEKAVWEGVK